MTDKISRRDFFLSLLAGALAAGVPLPVKEIKAREWCPRDEWFVTVVGPDFGTHRMQLYRKGELVRTIEYKTMIRHTGEQRRFALVDPA